MASRVSLEPARKDPPTGKAFDVGFSQTVRWNGDQVIEILAFRDTARQGF